jgi:hypothetical protein
MTVTTLPPLADLVTEIRRLATERPDFVYSPPMPNSSACYNVHRDEYGRPIPGAGCIVGQAMTNLGYVFDSEEDGQGVDEFYDDDDPDLVVWAAKVQTRQDGGATWANAVAAADEYVRTML